MINILKFVLFFASNFGYWTFLKKKTNIDIVFQPLITISIQIFILFFAGLFNILYVSSIALYLTGIGLSAYYLFSMRKKKKALKYYMNMLKNNSSIVVLVILTIIVLTIVRGTVLYSYDNFSHWGIVVKSMLINNRFPNFMDTIIMFQQYPLGSSTYIYYFAKMINSSESVLMTAQNYIIIASFLPILKYSKKNKSMSYIFLILFLNFILCLNIKINSLLVDTLLPVFSFGVLFFIYEEGIKSKNLNKCFLLLCIPMLSSIMLIKNSGVFFTIIGVIMLIYIMKKYHKWRSPLFYLIIISPFVIYFLWNSHCSYVYTNIEESKHAMLISNYTNVFSGKTVDDIKSISKSLFKYSISGKPLWIIVSYIVFVGILIFIFNRITKNNNAKIKGYYRLVLLSLILYVTYMVGTLGMYIFSMPLFEAETLASIERYRLTIFIFIYCLFSIYVIKIMNVDFKKKCLKYIISFLCLLSIMIINYSSFNRVGTVYNLMEYDNRRDRIESIIRDNKLDYNKKYFIVADNDNGYAYFFVRFLIYSDQVTVVNMKDTVPDTIKNYDYLINLTSNNSALQKYLKDNYSLQKDNQFVDLKDANKNK